MVCTPLNLRNVEKVVAKIQILIEELLDENPIQMQEELINDWAILYLICVIKSWIWKRKQKLICNSSEIEIRLGIF